jgi:RNA polymerase sigma-70 factor (ECF subfamily)
MRELSGLSDLILLGMVAEKDEAALREIVERHSPWLLLRLLRKTPDSDLAHEALHDTSWWHLRLDAK